MVILRNIDLAENRWRFYDAVIAHTVRQWSIIREWDRIGSPGRIAVKSFASEEARRAEQHTTRLRACHGYSRVSA
jgi:predicted DNA-binding WGR domain protein